MVEPEPAEVRILALWSPPRSRSTAFARMMAQRGDRVIVHEPFSLVTNFGEASVGNLVAHDQIGVLSALRTVASERPVFFKDTTDFHYPAVLADDSFLATATHTFIIRHPAEAIASHHLLNPDLTREEVGFSRLDEIFEAVRAVTGVAPVVVDSDDLLNHPADTVRAYCLKVGIPFLPEALQWQPGMRQEWRRTSRWHEATSLTSGFGRDANIASEKAMLDPKLRNFLEYHLPYYEKLRSFALRP